VKISVIIPTYNESRRLPKTYKSVISYLNKNFEEAEVIISDGGSTDGTQELIKQYCNNKEGRVETRSVIMESREGKGAGVKRGMLQAKYPFVLFMDADNSTSISQIEKLLPFMDRFEVVIGSRYAGLEAKVKQSILRRIISRAGGALIRMITGLRIQDTQCGFKLFTKEASDKIFSSLETYGWGFDIEVLLLATNFGYKIREVPVVWRDSEGSHVRAGQDSISTLIETIKISTKLNARQKTK